MIGSFSLGVVMTLAIVYFLRRWQRRKKIRSSGAGGGGGIDRPAGQRGGARIEGP